MSVVPLSPQWGIFETLLGATWGILSSPFTYVSLCPSAGLCLQSARCAFALGWD